jgi:hypothetical protein
MRLNNQLLQGTGVMILIGLIVREVFSFWMGHPYDFELWVRLGYAMVHGGDPYGSLPPVPGLSFANPYNVRDTPTIAYLPFWPLVMGSMYALYTVLGVSDRFVYYFLLKQPIILGDLALAYLLHSYVQARKATSASWVLKFWILSPFTVILSGMWGMFDSVAMAFVMLSLASQRWLRRSIFTGLAVFAKSIPVIHTIPLSIGKSRTWQSLLISIMLPVSLSTMIFVAMGWSFPAIGRALTYTITRWGESMSIWDSLFYFESVGILPAPTPAATTVAGAVWIPALLIATLVAVRKFELDTEYGMVQALILVTLVFLLFKARITEQYAIYFFALASIDTAIWNPRRRRILLATVAVVTFFLLLNNYFLIRFLLPTFPNAAQIESSLSQSIGEARLDTLFVAATAFTALNVWYLVELLRGRQSS